MIHYDIFISTRGNRDSVFDSLLARLKGAAQILEIGVARDLSPGARQADGWSSMHFGRYVSLHGGHLDLVDVSSDSLSNCSALMDSIPIRPSYSTHLMDGRDFLRGTSNQYDIILVDGSDDPGEMLECFELAKMRGRFILCDDFHVKGGQLRTTHLDFHLFTWENNPHEMGLYDTLNPLTPTTFNMPTIQ